MLDCSLMLIVGMIDDAISRCSINLEETGMLSLQKSKVAADQFANKQQYIEGQSVHNCL